MIQDFIRQLVDGAELSQEDAALATNEIMEGSATDAQIAGFLVALRMRGETTEVMAGMSEVMRRKAIAVGTETEVIDIVGTGGDGMRTFNISTAVALATATCGLTVAKHGNRAFSGLFGSADILEANGVKLGLTSASVSRCLRELGVGFMFAAAFHPAMRMVAGVRREMGIRTIFNVLGPLTNPANPKFQLIGSARSDLAERMANVVRIMGTRQAMIVHGSDGLDEISNTSDTQVWEVRGSQLRSYVLTPEDAGIQRSTLGEIQANDEEEHKALFLSSLGDRDCPARDIVLLNTGAALVVAGKSADLKAGVIFAREAMAGGRALERLDQLARLTQELE